MPDKKTVKKEAKTAKKAVKQGARLKKGATVAKNASLRSEKRASVASGTRKRKAQIRATTRAKTAQNLEKAGNEAIKTKKKVSTKGKVVTPRSAHKKRLEEQKKQGKYAAAGMKKSWRKEAKGK